jgi:hypothetical protein
MCFLLVAAILSLAIVPRLIYPALTSEELRGVSGAASRIQLQQAQGLLQNNFRTTILQVIAGMLVVAGAITTWQQVRIGREGHITDRLSRAIDQIGSSNLDVRLGGLYALERIAKNSPDDRVTVQFLMAAFVRNHAPWPTGTEAGQGKSQNEARHPWLRYHAPDVQTAIHVLARRPRMEKRTLVLSHVNLRGLHLEHGNLSHAEFTNSNLACAILRDSRFDRSDFHSADLQAADLIGSVFVAADLRNSNLKSANLSACNLTNADLRGADLSGATLDGCDLAGAKASCKTKFPDTFDRSHLQAAGVVFED